MDDDADTDARRRRPAVLLSVGEYIEEGGRAHRERGCRIGSGLPQHTTQYSVRFMRTCNDALISIGG
jgi:hypothetical protein